MESPIEIFTTEQDRSFWLSQGLANQNFAEVSAAEVLIVPLKYFREGVPFVFHQDTASFARYLTKHLVGQAKVEVLADDDEYVEIALHGASFRISTIVVGYVMAPLLINLLSSYIYDELKAKSSDSVEMNLVIEDHECRAMHVGFKGNAKDFVLVADKVNQISLECMAANTNKKTSPPFNSLNKQMPEVKSHELPDE